MDLFEYLLAKVIPIPKIELRIFKNYEYKIFLPYENQLDDFVKVNKVNSNQVINNDMVIQVDDFLISQKKSLKKQQNKN